MKETVVALKALADATRLRLVALLAHGEMCVCDLTCALGLPQSTVSRHLGHLKNAGLVADRKQGVWAFYRLAESRESGLAEVTSLLAARLRETATARQDLTKFKECKTSLDRVCE